MCLKIKEKQREQMDLIEEENCISNEKDRINLIFFDSKEDEFIVTDKREGVCRQHQR